MKEKEYRICHKIFSTNKEMKRQIFAIIQCRVKKETQKGFILL